jgi:hypothetical protein
MMPPITSKNLLAQSSMKELQLSNATKEFGVANIVSVDESYLFGFHCMKGYLDSIICECFVRLQCGKLYNELEVHSNTQDSFNYEPQHICDELHSCHNHKS